MTRIHQKKAYRNLIDATWVDKINGYSPLHWSSYLGYPTIVEALLANARIDPMLKAGDGMNALHHAAYSGNKHVVAVMLRDQRIDLEALTGPLPIAEDGATALQIAQNDYQDWDKEAVWCKENISECGVQFERDRAGVAELLMSKANAPKAAEANATPAGLAGELQRLELAPAASPSVEDGHT